MMMDSCCSFICKLLSVFLLLSQSCYYYHGVVNGIDTTTATIRSSSCSFLLSASASSSSSSSSSSWLTSTGRRALSSSPLASGSTAWILPPVRPSTSRHSKHHRRVLLFGDNSRRSSGSLAAQGRTLPNQQQSLRKGWTHQQKLGDSSRGGGVICYAGFGSSSSSSSTRSSSKGSKKKKKGSGSGSSSETASSSGKLKPKQQWDRFNDLKKSTMMRVAVRKRQTGTSNTSDDDDEWLEVGHVRSIDDSYTEIAIAKQRALIVEHANRMYPSQISSKDTVDWAYYNDEQDCWSLVNSKSVLQELTASEDQPKKQEPIEKMIGFQGTPDPQTGYYCSYNEGRLVSGTTGQTSLPKPAKKLADKVRGA